MGLAALSFLEMWDHTVIIVVTINIVVIVIVVMANVIKYLLQILYRVLHMPSHI